GKEVSITIPGATYATGLAGDAARSRTLDKNIQLGGEFEFCGDELIVIHHRITGKSTTIAAPTSEKIAAIRHGIQGDSGAGFKFTNTLFSSIFKKPETSALKCSKLDIFILISLIDMNF
ncbi:MAG: hypothetical protein GY782_10490, partial [Gammaproteobacteria bacterium]|nr:hypothetical protein [Gammaproteobacteria bacterium]